jgi:hypothetical protein
MDAKGPRWGTPCPDGAGYMSTFGALDIAVCQSYYGANESYNSR